MIIEQDGSRTELSDSDTVFNRTHLECDVCSETVCSRNTDGTSDCPGCDHEMGEFICDDMGPVSCVHDDCRAQYVTLAVRDAIKESLMVRVGFEINSMTASERANNLAVSLMELFKIEIK